MYVSRMLEKIKWDNIINWFPLIFSYVLFMIETDNKARFVVVLAICIILITYLSATNHQNISNIGERKRQRADLTYGCSISAVLVYLSWYNLFYFFIGIVTIPLIIYKLFEFIGDITEILLDHKVKIPLILVSYIKFSIWLLGFIVFITSFFGFIVWFVTLYPNHSVTLLLMESQSDIVMVIGIIAFSLIIAVFIIDYLIKMVFFDMKPVSFKIMSRFEVQQMFFKVAFVIIFADLAYSLMYLTFSGIKLREVVSFNDYLLLLLDYVRSFYYAFSLHFAIPMPTTDFFAELDALVKKTSAMQIIQFFHFCLNKIVDITILAYMAGIILSSLGFKKGGYEE